MFSCARIQQCTIVIISVLTFVFIIASMGLEMYDSSSSEQVVITFKDRESGVVLLIADTTYNPAQWKRINKTVTTIASNNNDSAVINNEIAIKLADEFSIISIGTFRDVIKIQVGNNPNE